MINILDITEHCSSVVLTNFLTIMKSILNIIQVFEPIILIISLAIRFTKLTLNPDDKDEKKKIKNSIIATVLLFFIPFFINVSMILLGNSFSIAACWNAIGDSSTTSNYQSKKDDNKKKIFGNNDNYEKAVVETPGPPAVPLPGNTPYPSQTPNPDSTTTPSNPSTPVSGKLEIHFINPNSRVDAIYIKSGNQSMFIDGGFKKDGQKEIEYLNKIGVTNITYYLGSHSHKDHVEAAPPIISKYGINKIFVGRETCKSSSSTCTWEAISYFSNEQNVNIGNPSVTILKPGDTFNIGSAKITVLGPISITNGMSRGDGKQNQNSIIFRLDFGSKSFLFTGDASSSSKYKEIEEYYPGLVNVNVMKNAHHNGNDGSSTYKLIAPEYVVFLTDDEHLPSNSLLNTLSQNGCKKSFIVTNSKDGNVVFTSDGNSLNITTNYNP